MIEITNGFTSITAGADAIEPPPWPDAGESPTTCRRRAPTGARVTLEFSRAEALPPDQPVSVRYVFGGGGAVREVVGFAKPTHVEVQWGRAAVYHYRLSYWIAPAALMSMAAGNVRQRAPTAARRLASGGKEPRGDLIRA